MKVRTVSSLALPDGTAVAQLVTAASCPFEVRPVSPRKRAALLAAAVSLFILAVSATSEAQWYPIPYPPPYRWADPESAVRLEVTPKEAEVYVDGYYAGVVDDFDGMFQRLRLPPGEHEITLYRDGFRSVTQRSAVVKRRRST